MAWFGTLPHPAKPGLNFEPFTSVSAALSSVKLFELALIVMLLRLPLASTVTPTSTVTGVVIPVLAGIGCVGIGVPATVGAPPGNVHVPPG